ncbi:cupredoxin domain-containing protein [Psychrobacter lutiphocae]|uniref:cupredoxin domain-containing protein n=1 Tax=Psychrobacter lutiphocae TaxID=540500 RepID=UPI000371CF92|nr:cupredoxin domain-containing protein [Psychrobacter lutiphocae]
MRKNQHTTTQKHWSLRLLTVIMVALLSTTALLSTSAMAAKMPNIGKSTTLDKNGYSKQVHHPRYDDLPAYLVEINNGKLLPPKLVVPAKTKFRIVVRNIGTRPAEFESNKLRQEKVLYMGTESVVVIMPLDKGEYDYFDEFTPGAQGKIIAK